MAGTLSSKETKTMYAADWAANNPLLDEGEIGTEVDTGVLKVGDGTTRYNSLSTASLPKVLTGTATAGAVTLAARAGKITTEALTTAQNLFYTLTITNSAIAATDAVFASVANGTNTQGTPMITSVTPGAESLIIVIQNKHASAEALNGTLVVSFFSVKI